MPTLMDPPCAAKQDLIEYPDTAVVCVIGRTKVLESADMLPLHEQGVMVCHWTQDDAYGPPPTWLDWADGFIVLDVDPTQASTWPQLQSVMKMAWRCGRTICLAGTGTLLLPALGFDPDVPAEAEGLLICAEAPCSGTLAEFADALCAQPHAGRSQRARLQAA